MTVKERVLQAVRRNGMFPADCTAVVGFSGGADSTALLHVLYTLRQEGELAAVVAVHINHQLRDEESVKDEAFTREFCRQYDIPLFVFTEDVAQLAAQQGKGLEETGRELRYTAFSEVAKQFPSARICTAHNADDNAETVLLHLTRGCGLHGLTGIPAVRDNIVRPLLDCTRDEIEAYCRENQLNFVTDSTNEDVTYSRNRIRHQVLPSLRQINPAAVRAILRLARQAEETEQFLQRQAEAVIPALVTEQEGVYRKAELLQLDPVLQRVVLNELLKKAGATAEEQHLQRMVELLPATGAVMLPQTFCFRVLKRTVSVAKAASEMMKKIPVKPGDTVDFGGETYTLLLISREKYEQNLNNCKFFFKNACDYAMISGELHLRCRKNGDAYHPAGRGCGKTLKQLFQEAALPPENRNTVPLLCDEAGILFPFGFSCDERAAITKGTEKILVLKKTEE